MFWLRGVHDFAAYVVNYPPPVGIGYRLYYLRLYIRIFLEFLQPNLPYLTWFTRSLGMTH